MQPYNGTLTFLSSKKTEDREPAGGRSPAREPAMAGAGQDGNAAWSPNHSDLDDDIPF